MCGAEVRPGDQSNGDYGGFLTWLELVETMGGWLRKHPHLVRCESLGNSTEGRPIPILKISDNPAADEDEPEALLLFGVHPREQAPTLTLVRLVSELLDRHGRDERLTRLLNEREIWVVPMLNIDGKIYDMQHGNGASKGADWRKNRRPNGDGTFGVDLNRNFPIRWGGDRSYSEEWKSATDQTRGNVYEGPSPGSEPETRALMDFVRSRPLRLMVDVHSPLHDLRAPAYLIPSEAERYSRLFAGMRAAQKEPYPTSVLRPGIEPPLDGRGGNTGVSFIWSYYTQGIFSFNIEFGLKVRYPEPERIEQEYSDNIRGPLLFLLDACAELPLRSEGTARVARAATDGPLVPGAKVLWTPAIEGDCDYAVLESGRPEIVVKAEYRLVPLKRGFQLEVAAHAQPGTAVPLTLYLWNRKRERSIAAVQLTVQAAAASTVPAPPAQEASAKAAAPTLTRVAIYDHSNGTAKAPGTLEGFLTKMAGFQCWRVRPEDIRGGVLKEVDVLIMPGGSGSKQAAMLEAAGLENIRQFVRAGGGYVGICAGSYLATTFYPWSLGLLNAKVVDREHWARGTGPVKLSITPTGKEALAHASDEVEVHYGQGPLLAPDTNPELPAYEPLAIYASEIARKGAPTGVMMGTTAIARGTFGEGRVIRYSPHPEAKDGSRHLVFTGVQWAGAARPAK